MTTLLIQNGCVLTMDEQNTIHLPGWVWVADEEIQAVGANQPPADLATRADRVIDASHMAVLPGLVNGHTHLSQTFMRGLGDDKPLLDWLKQIMWPIQAAMTVEDMRLASLLGLVENLRCGVTSLVQHHKITTSAEHTDATAAAAQFVGVRLRLARGWVDLGDAGESSAAIIDEMTRLHHDWHQSAGGRITVGFGPMAAWRCSDDMMRKTVMLAREWGMTTHIHVAEAHDEIELMRHRNGLRHIEWLDSLELLSPDMQLVHCVQVDEKELDLIAAGGAVVIHCPVSNMYLASGVAPVRAMLNRSITVALGTDGSASHNSQDLLETMKIAALLAKVDTGEATALLPMDILRMVTVTGAQLLGQSNLGQIKPGFKADITLVNLNTARSMPVHRPESALVFNATGPDVHTVMVDGQILLDAGRVVMLDETALLAECRAAATQLLARAGVTR
jgi:5-methylthioadenosine/S-adenosylhomocysteine deaminase